MLKVIMEREDSEIQLRNEDESQSEGAEKCDMMHPMKSVFFSHNIWSIF